MESRDERGTWTDNVTRMLEVWRRYERYNLVVDPRRGELLQGQGEVVDLDLSRLDIAHELASIGTVRFPDSLRGLEAAANRHGLTAPNRFWFLTEETVQRPRDWTSEDAVSREQSVAEFRSHLITVRATYDAYQSLGQLWGRSLSPEEYAQLEEGWRTFRAGTVPVMDGLLRKLRWNPGINLPSRDPADVQRGPFIPSHNFTIEEVSLFEIAIAKIAGLHMAAVRAMRCEECLVPYVSEAGKWARKDSKYCSKQCRQRAAYKRRKEGGTS
jgi:hypothetical protein